MFFVKCEYPIAKSAKDVLNWLEKDLLQAPISSIAGEKVRVAFQPLRTDNQIEVKHILRDALTGEYLGEGVAFVFEVEQVTDSDTLVISKYQENIYIERLFYLYLARLGAVLHADFKEYAFARLQEIQAQIDKERGGRLGWTQWRTLEGTNIQARAFGVIPNDSEPAPQDKAPDKDEHADEDAVIRYGTDKDLSLTEVKAIVKRCKAWRERGGKVTEFHNKYNRDKYSLETLRKWLKDSKFSE